MSRLTLVKDCLDSASLRALVSDEICALRIPEYCTHESRERLQRYINNSALEDYQYVGGSQGEVKRISFGIKRVGIPFNSTYFSERGSDAREKYYRNAQSGICQLREACSPFLSPIDKLRLELDEIWPLGATLASFEGQKMFAGICRIMEPQDPPFPPSQPHFDALPSQVCTLSKQFSANIYIDVPDSGGELELWNVPPIAGFEVSDVDVDVERRTSLPEPITISPKARDLILFNTRRPHAIRQFERGIRSSLQCFIGITSLGSIEVWS